MVEEQKRRIEREIGDIVNELDRNYLRKMQGDMHRCAAQCCDSTLALEQVHNCVERCGVPLQHANNYVQQELNQLQNKLQRCVLICNDDAKDSLKKYSEPTQAQIDHCTTEFEKCAMKCVDKQIGLLPSLMSAMKRVLEKKSYPQTEPMTI